MPGETNDLPIGDQVEQWLRTQKPTPLPEGQEPVEQRPQRMTDKDVSNMIGGLTDYFARKEQSRAELPERMRRLYAENPTYREITDLYHDFFGAISSVPEFREAVRTTYEQINQDDMYDQFNPRRGDPQPLLNMLDRIFNEGIEVRFRKGDYLYDAYTHMDSAYCRDLISISRCKSPLNETAQQAEDDSVRERFKYDERIIVNIDKGMDSDIYLEKGVKRDYLHDNASSVVDISYHSPIPVFEQRFDDQILGDYDISQQPPEALENARVMLAALVASDDQSVASENDNRWIDRILRAGGYTGQEASTRPAEFSTLEASEQFTRSLMEKYLDTLRKIPGFADKEAGFHAQIENAMKDKTTEKERREAIRGLGFKGVLKPMVVNVGNNAILVDPYKGDHAWKSGPIGEKYYDYEELVVLVGPSEQIDKLRYYSEGKSVLTGRTFEVDSGMLRDIRPTNGVSRIGLRIVRNPDGSTDYVDISESDGNETEVATTTLIYADGEEYNKYITDNFAKVQEKSQEVIGKLQTMIGIS